LGHSIGFILNGRIYQGGLIYEIVQAVPFNHHQLNYNCPPVISLGHEWRERLSSYTLCLDSETWISNDV